MNTSLPATTVATINKQQIIIIENGEKRVAVRPICDALGVAYQSQIERLKSDPILSSTVTLSMTVGADKKEREMVTIPFKYVFGWLFRIDSRNVKPEAKETVLKYQMECYDALYNHFTGYAEFVEFRQKQMDDKLAELKEVKRQFSDAKDKLKAAEQELEQVRQFTYADYKQLKFEFPEDEPIQEGGEDE